MPRESYQRRLDELRGSVVDMADLVFKRYDAAIEAAETGDDDLAREVIEGDHEVNDRYLALEDECTELLALQQPVAGDLRLVTASFKIITDLERVGDLATNLAEYGASSRDENEEHEGHEGHEEYEEGDGHRGGIHPAVDVRGIGEEAGDMLRDAVAAYETADPEACRAVAARDDELDERCQLAGEQVVRELLARSASDGVDDETLAAELDDVSRVLLTIRDLERVGDHAVNVAARALYMAESDDALIY